MSLRKRFILAGAAYLLAPLMGLLPAPQTWAQNYPTRPIRMIVPFAPGGNTDIIARAIVPRMVQDLGQQILIDNRGGAGSTIGTNMAAKSSPDGYTLLMVSSAHVINPAARKNMPYDSVKDFAAVTLVADVPNVLAVHPSLPVKNIMGLTALARTRPGELLYATPGRGTSSHLAIEMLASSAKINLTQVPYKGVGPATIDLVAGHVHMMFASMPASIQHVRSGRLRMIAQAGAVRSPAAPEVPTMIEQGMHDFVVSSGFGMFAPAGTPRAIVDRVNAAVRKALNDPDVRSSLSSQGAEPVGNSPDEYDKYNRTEIEKWSKVARQAGVQAE
ncbi:MAG: tripartite tricarboxylate transporter substrate binding protein [Burkholderiales bacterium]|nr:tripartite tricarboxylate transporter substrate binding protein [Burkholderiales bacterium]